MLRLAGDSGASGSSQVVVNATDGTFSVSDTFTVTTDPVTGIASRTPVRRVVRELGAPGRDNDSPRGDILDGPSVPGGSTSFEGLANVPSLHPGLTPPRLARSE